MESNQNQKKAGRGKKLLATLIPLLVGAAIGLVSAMALGDLAGDDSGLYFLYLGVFLLSLIVSFLAQIILHEAGHLVFGRLTGYRFVSFNVLGHIWQKDKEGRVRHGRMQIAGAGGQCLMAPPDYNGGDFPFTAYNLGGVMMNLIVALVCALLMWANPFVVPDILLGCMIGVGVFFALTNGLPIPVAAIQNDGRNLTCIRRDLHARRAFWAQMAIAAALAEGTRIKSMPDEWFAPFPEEEMDNPIVSAIAVMNTTRLMDEMNFPAAEEAIHALLSRKKGILGLYRTSMACDGAVCELIAGRPGPLTAMLAEEQHAAVIKAMKAHPTILRTQYAIALLRDRDADAAARLLDAFEKAAKTHPNPQEIAGEREILFAVQQSALKGGAA